MPNLEGIKDKILDFWKSENMQKVKQMVGGISIACTNKLQELTGQNLTTTSSNPSAESVPNLAPQNPSQETQQVPNSPLQTGEILANSFTVEKFLNEEKVSLKNTPNSSISLGKIKDGTKIRLWSNRESKNGEFMFEKTIEYVLRYTKPDKSKNPGKWKIIEPKKYCRDYSIDNGEFLGIGGALELKGDILNLKNQEILKSPKLQLDIQLVKPKITNQEQAQIDAEKEQKTLDEVYKDEQKKFQELTKDIPTKEIARLCPNELSNADGRTQIACAKDYFEALDKSGNEIGIKETQGKRSTEFAIFNKLLGAGKTAVKALQIDTLEDAFLNSLLPANPQTGQQSQANSPITIYEEYLTQKEKGRGNNFIQELAEKMVKKILQIDQFSSNLINEPTFPNLNKVFGNLKSLLSQVAVYFSKTNLTPNSSNFGEINFAKNRLFGDDKKGKDLQTIKQMLAVGISQFFIVKITLRMQEIDQGEIDKKTDLENQRKTEFLDKIKEVNGKIKNYTTEVGLNDEELVTFKNQIINKYQKDSSIPITLVYLEELLNIENLSDLNDNPLSFLFLNFGDLGQINIQNEVLTKLESTCDYVIALENAKKSFQNLTQKFIELQEKIPNLVEKIINESTIQTNRSNIGRLLKSLTTNGKIDDKKVQEVKKDLEEKIIENLQTSQKWHKLTLEKINETNEKFETEITIEKERIEEKAAKLKLYEDTLSQIKELEKDKTGSNFYIYKLVHSLDSEIKGKIWEEIKDKEEIISTGLSKDDIFDVTNNKMIYRYEVHYSVCKAMKLILENEIKELT